MGVYKEAASGFDLEVAKAAPEKGVELIRKAFGRVAGGLNDALLKEDELRLGRALQGAKKGLSVKWTLENYKKPLRKAEKRNIKNQYGKRLFERER